MFFGVSIGELAVLAAAIVAGGITTGLLAGLFGIGGGAIIVPVLYEVFRVLGVPDEVRMQLCVGTSMAIIVPTTIRSYQAHKARGAVMLDVVRAWTLPAVAGVAIGSLIVLDKYSVSGKFTMLAAHALLVLLALLTKETAVFLPLLFALYLLLVMRKKLSFLLILHLILAWKYYNY